MDAIPGTTLRPMLTCGVRLFGGKVRWCVLSGVEDAPDVDVIVFREVEDEIRELLD